MSDRDLRDEIERLSSEVREARRKLDFSTSVSAGAERIRTLRTRLDVGRKQRDALVEQIAASEKALREQEDEAVYLGDELARARRRIGQLEPLGNPWERDRLNWESQDAGTGCLQLVVGFVGVGLGAVTWWLT